IMTAPWGAMGRFFMMGVLLFVCWFTATAARLSAIQSSPSHGPKQGIAGNKQAGKTQQASKPNNTEQPAPNGPLVINQTNTQEDAPSRGEKGQEIAIQRYVLWFRGILAGAA